MAKAASSTGASGRLWRLLTTESYRHFVGIYRDFYANPRSADYMAARVEELAENALTRAKIVLVAVNTSSVPTALVERQRDVDVVSGAKLCRLGYSSYPGLAIR